MKKLSGIIVVFPILAYIALNISTMSCTHESELIEKLDTVCFETEIFPIISSSCGITGCHIGGGSGEFNASSYNSIMAAVTPGDAKNSLLYKVLTRTYGQIMPPDKPLNKNQRTLIQVWIQQGALNTKCNTSIDSPGTIDNPDIFKDSVCFTQNVQPILNSNCATTNCHDNITHLEGYNFSTYASILSNSDAVQPYLPNESKMFKVLFATGEDRMPPSPFIDLSAENKEVIRKWIAEGALNSDCPTESCDTLLPISFSKHIWPVVNRSCVGCHNSSSNSGGGVLDSYTGVKNVALEQRNGTSLLLGVIRKETGFVGMPPTGQLNDCIIRQFELWVEQGMPDN